MLNAGIDRFVRNRIIKRKLKSGKIFGETELYKFLLAFMRVTTKYWIQFNNSCIILIYWCNLINFWKFSGQSFSNLLKLKIESEPNPTIKVTSNNFIRFSSEDDRKGWRALNNMHNNSYHVVHVQMETPSVWNFITRLIEH